jgi:hypothetical protein
MTIYTETFQACIDADFAPIGLDEPYRGFCVLCVAHETGLMIDCRIMDSRMENVSMQIDDGLISGWNPEIREDNNKSLLTQGINNFNGVEMFKVFTVGIDKDIRINQIYGQDIPRKACPGQGLVCLYDRDERLEFSSEEFSSLFFVMVLFSFSDKRRSLLLHQAFQEASYLKCSLSFFVLLLASALFNPMFIVYLKLTKRMRLVNYWG